MERAIQGTEKERRRELLGEKCQEGSCFLEGGTFAGIAPARGEPGRFRGFIAWIRLIRLAKHVDRKLSNDAASLHALACFERST